MRLLKRLTCLVLALACLFALTMPVLANGENSLTITYKNGGEILAGAPFSIYRVAWEDETGNLVVAEGFAKYNVNISNDETTWPALASTLVAYAAMGRIRPDAQGVTNPSGILQIAGLADGIYLVEGALHQQSDQYFTSEPALIRLPGRSPTTGAVDRNVTMAPKAEWVPNGGGDDFEEETIKVLKVWEDDGAANRPKSVTVHLLADGLILDTVKLQEENRWQHTWEDLEVGHNYTVAEDNVDGYTITIQRRGITFVVTNTQKTVTLPHDPVAPGTPGTPDVPPVPDSPEAVIPETGQPWSYVLLLTAAGLLFLVIGLYIRRGADHEA